MAMTNVSITGIILELAQPKSETSMRIHLEREDSDMNRKGNWCFHVSGAEEVMLSGDQLNHIFRLLNKTVDGEIS